MQLDLSNEDCHVDYADTESVSQKITRESLAACKDNLNHAAARLEGHMKEVTRRIIQKSKVGVVSKDDVADLERLQDEWNAARDSVKLCTVAGQHLKNNVSTIENYGVGDSVQFMVSTNGQVIHGKNRGIGWKNRQVGGQMSDNVALQLSQDIVKESSQRRHPEGLPSRTRMPSEFESSLQEYSNAPFEGRHGRGFKLEDQPTPSTVIPAISGASAHKRPDQS